MKKIVAIIFILTLILTMNACGVESETPKVSIEKIMPEKNRVTFEVNVTDLEEIGNIKTIELYQDETRVESLTDLTKREFTELFSDTEYRIELTYVYQYDDEKEKTLTITKAFTTLKNTVPFLSIENIVPEKEKVTFEVSVIDSDQIGELTTIQLYQGETRVESLTDLTKREFNGLLSDTEYQIVVTYTYDLNDGESEQVKTATKTFTTLGKTVPLLSIENLVPKKEGVKFEVSVTDIDRVGELTTIQLYQGETRVESLTDLTKREFTGLLSDTEYQIVATYTYDLNDGESEQVKTVTNTFTTLGKTVPLLSIENLVPEKEGVKFEVSVTDIDQVGKITSIELYYDENVVKSLTDLTVREFSGLQSDTEYQLVITYRYDLNDGEDEQVFIVTKSFSTETKATPIVSVEELVTEKEKVTFEVSVTDIDQVGEITSIELYYDETVIKSLTDLTVREFTELQSDSEYQIVVTYTFDLNDGSQAQYIITTKTFKTNAYTMPNVSVSQIVSENDKVSFDLVTIDPDQLGEITDIQLYQGESLVKSLTDLTVREFTGLQSDTEYLITATIIYDLNDGKGEQIQELELFKIYNNEVFKLINNKHDFSLIQSTGNYILNNNIDFNGDYIGKIGDVDNPFVGYFNGMNYTISNFKLSNENTVSGIFSVNEGTIENLRISDINLSGNCALNSSCTIGVLVGINTGIVQNIELYGALNYTVTGSSQTLIVGGLIGENHYGSQVVNINADLNIEAETIGEFSNLYLGGIIGQYYGGYVSTIDIDGKIIGKSVFAVLAGGVIGYSARQIELSDVHSKAVIEGYNTSTVMPKSGWVSSGGIIGGIPYVGNGSLILIENTSFDGNVYSDSHAGGIAGYIHANEPNFSIILQNNDVKGNVFGNSYLGGLVGETYHGGDDSTLLVSNNHTQITTDSNNSNYTLVSAGGLIGEVNGGQFITIETSYSESHIELYSAINVGGLIGKGHTNIVLKDSFFSGSINLSSKGLEEYESYLGGLVGLFAGEIKNSYFTGEIITTSIKDVGGLTGKIEYGSIINSYFHGNLNVSSTNYGFITSVSRYSDIPSVLE